MQNYKQVRSVSVKVERPNYPSRGGGGQPARGGVPRPRPRHHVHDSIRPIRLTVVLGLKTQRQQPRRWHFCHKLKCNLATMITSTLEENMTSNRAKFRILTAITLYPAVDRAMICLKNTSAFPLAGGKNTTGHRTLFGPASYNVHTLSPSSSTIICRKLMRFAQPLIIQEKMQWERNQRFLRYLSLRHTAPKTFVFLWFHQFTHCKLCAHTHWSTYILLYKLKQNKRKSVQFFLFARKRPC